MGLMDFIMELAGEEPGQNNNMINVNDRNNFMNRPGALYLCVNKESMKVTSVRLCDFQSRLKEDTFESFIKGEVKKVKKLDFIPNESVFYYYVPDLSTCPRVFKEDNDHFIPYIQNMQPQMRIELTDAVFAVKHDIDLIQNGSCFSGLTSKVGHSKRYQSFIESNERDKQRTVLNFYLDNIEEDYRKTASISVRNPINVMLHRLGNDTDFVELLVRNVEKRKAVSGLLMDMLFPVLYNTPWGQKNISNDAMLNYVAKYDMKYLGAEFKNHEMLEFFQRNDLFDAMVDWSNAVEAMDDYVLHRRPDIDGGVISIPGLTASETLYRNILNKGSIIGRLAYLKLCNKIKEELAINPTADISGMYPDFERADCKGARPQQPDPIDYGPAEHLYRQPEKKSSFFHF